MLFLFENINKTQKSFAHSRRWSMLASRSFFSSSSMDSPVSVRFLAFLASESRLRHALVVRRFITEQRRAHLGGGETWKGIKKLINVFVWWGFRMMRSKVFRRGWLEMFLSEIMWMWPGGRRSGGECSPLYPHARASAWCRADRCPEWRPLGGGLKAGFRRGRNR